MGCRFDLDLAAARIERAVFADCDLRETSLAEAVLRDVRFERCDLGGVDADRVRLQRVELRGCRLDGIRSVENLRGAAMPWEDIVGNAGLFAAAVGVRAIEPEWRPRGGQPVAWPAPCSRCSSRCLRPVGRRPASGGERRAAGDPVYVDPTPSAR